MDYSKHITNHLETKQSEKVTGISNQKRNNAGGIVFKISKWDYLMRFLILGTEGGTYYVSERKLTKDACKNVQLCIDEDGIKTVDLIVDVSTSGRSANNDAAIFALAMAASCNDSSVRKYALSKLNDVCRIGTHLFHFIAFVKTMRGFGRGLRDSLANWYTTKKVEDLAYQMLKYQGRDGWDHKDVLRLSHPQPVNESMNKLFSFAVGKLNEIPPVSDYAIGMEKLKFAKHPSDGAEIIRKYKLTREAVSTNFLNEVTIWEALLDNMPMTALIRNLGKMATLNMHKPLTNSLKLTIEKITNDNAIARSKIHPLTLLNAYYVYANGKGIKGSLQWEVSPKVIDAIEYAFYKSFGNVEPTNKNIMLALDVSGSMTSYKIPGGILDCREASGCMSMVTMKTEENVFVTGFTTKGKHPISTGSYYTNRAICELNISNSSRLSEVIASISNLPFSGTDCALPMLYCINRGIDVDAIVIYTDSETWAGDIHPWQALDKLEQKLGHTVKLVTVGMVATKFSIARTDYANMIDFVGFDTNSPQAISEFIKL